MSTVVGAPLRRQVRTVPLHRLAVMLWKDPVNGMAEIGRKAAGDVVRLNLGPFRPYLVSHPDHVRHVLKTNWRNYVRKGMFWDPLERLLGRSILGDGPEWESSRKILQPLFTARYVTSLAEQLARIIDDGVGALERYARAGEPIDVAIELGRVVNLSVIQVLFGGRLSAEDADRVAPAYETAATSFGLRMLMPFLPYSIPVPGDRRFMAAVKTINEVVLPVIARARQERSDGNDIISALCRSRKDDGGELDDKQLRDDLVSIYGAASETTAMALTWLWPLLHDHPEVAARLQDEVDRVVGDGPVLPDHLPRLTYMKMVLQELLRLYPSGWMLPRLVVQSEEVGGVVLKAGSQVLLSPYTTHRLDEFWDRPLDFDPERFAPGNDRLRHRYAYFPFGGGPHTCLGQHLFYIEAPFVIGNILRRFRPELVYAGPYVPVPAPSVRPKQRVRMLLHFRRTS